MSSGSVLIFGGRAKALEGRLSAMGYACETALAPAVPRAILPDAIVVAAGGRNVAALVRTVRKQSWLRHIPVLVDQGTLPSGEVKSLDVDGIAGSSADLEKMLRASVAARRLEHQEQLVRRRLELLVEMSHASRLSENLTKTVVTHIKDVFQCRSVALLSLFGAGPTTAQWLDGKRTVAVDLSVSPKLRGAVEQHTPVFLDNAWLVPLRGPIAAVRLKREAPLTAEEVDFLHAVGLAFERVHSVQQTTESQLKTRDTLESAYVERYRELIEANRRLNAVDRRKNELLAVLSHDLRAPLNVQLGHAHLLLSDSELADSLKPSVQAIQRSAKRILEMIEGLLEKSRLGEGRLPLFSKSMDVAETCHEAGRELGILATEKGLTLSVEVPISLFVLGDELKIRQVIQNLVTNALTHARGASKVTLKAILKKRPDGDVAQIEVQDNGVVEDPNAVLLAFDRSKGIGLSIAREYVERHGGEIWAEAPPTGGARFAFTLPVRAERKAPQRTSASAAPLVLVAEDDPIFARMCEVGLSSKYRVELLRDGSEVIARSKALMPDAIVLDVFLPHRDGLELLRELKGLPETAHIPVVLISGLPDIDEKLRSLDLGAFDFLTKPFPLSVLLGRLSAAVSRSNGGATNGLPGSDRETGLFDHFGMLNRLNEEMNRSAHYRRPLTVAVLHPADHPPGDIPLAARTVRKSLRTPDVVAHIGHGVWAVLLPETSDLEAVPVLERLAERLRDSGTAYVIRALDVGASTQTGEAILENLLSPDSGVSQRPQSTAEQ